MMKMPLSERALSLAMRLEHPDVWGPHDSAIFLGPQIAERQHRRLCHLLKERSRCSISQCVAHSCDTLEALPDGHTGLDWWSDVPVEYLWSSPLIQFAATVLTLKFAVS